MSEPEVLIRVEGGVGRITLNRPGALHALTTAMCRDMTAALLAWRTDPAVRLVLLDHTGERGFCAGGDIRMLAESGAGDGKAAQEFFFVEYQLNELLFRYPKTTVALMDGVVMGGGVGLSRPCRFRVATERTTFAMPETAIGLFPDVGGGWYLPRMPDHIGLWLGLTGARLKAADCELVGIATDCVPSADLPRLTAGILADPTATETLLTELEMDAGRPPISAHQDEVARLFAGDSVEAIIAALEGADTEWSRAQAQTLKTKSPQSLKVTFRQLQLGRQARSFAENMALEHRLASRVARSHDFAEGVRAVVVDKDNTPRWNPPDLAGVTEAYLDRLFAPMPPDEAWRPLQLETA